MLATDIYFILLRLTLLREAHMGMRVCLTLFWQQLLLKTSLLHMNSWLQIVKMGIVKSCCQCGAGEALSSLFLLLSCQVSLFLHYSFSQFLSLMPCSRQLTNVVKLW